MKVWMGNEGNVLMGMGGLLLEACINKYHSTSIQCFKVLKKDKEEKINKKFHCFKNIPKVVYKSLQYNLYFIFDFSRLLQRFERREAFYLSFARLRFSFRSNVSFCESK